MKKNVIHTALFRLVVPIPYGALIYVLLLMINNNLLSLSASFLSAELFFCITLSYIIFEANRFTFVGIFPEFSLKLLPNLLLYAVNLVLSLLLVYISLYVYFVVILGFSSIAGFDTEVKSFAIFFGITSVLLTTLSISFLLLNKQNEDLIEDEETLRSQVLYELEDYRAEVNPALLFECLESAILLLNKDIDIAEDYIDRLALVYRYMLTNRDKDTIALKKDIEAAENLIALHNVKYENLIYLKKEEGMNDCAIIPGSLPLLIEEIIKSTLIFKERPLTIILGREDNYFTLSYKMNERLVRNNDEAAMFRRLQATYAYFCDLPLIKVQAYGDSFYKIPILTKNAA